MVNLLVLLVNWRGRPQGLPNVWNQFVTIDEVRYSLGSLRISLTRAYNCKKYWVITIGTLKIVTCTWYSIAACVLNSLRKHLAALVCGPTGQSHCISNFIACHTNIYLFVYLFWKMIDQSLINPILVVDHAGQCPKLTNWSDFASVFLLSPHLLFHHHL